MSGRTKVGRPWISEEDRQKYIKAWEEVMIKIWQEKIVRLRVIDTRALHNQIRGSVTGSGTDFSVIVHKFLLYGLYQDSGTGRGYAKGNGGNLDFLDPLKRTGNRKRKQESGKVTSGEPRQRRQWFSKAYYRSRMVLKEQMAYMYGEEFVGILTEALEKPGRTRRI